VPRIPVELLQFDRDPAQTTEADRLVAQHHAVAAWMMDENPVPVFTQVQERGGSQSLEDTAVVNMQEQLNAIRTFVQGELEINPEQAAMDIELLPQIEDDIRAEAGTPFFAYEQLVEQMVADEPDVDRGLIEYEAEQAVYGTIMAGVFDNDWKGTAADFVASMFFPNESKIAADIVEGGWWTSANDVAEFASVWNAMDREDRLNSFVSLVDSVKERTPNELKALQFLNSVVDPMETANLGFAHAMDKLGAGAVVADIGLLGYGIARRAMNPIRQLHRLNKDKKAAELLTMASEQPDIARAVSLDPIEAQPTSFSIETLGVPEGVSREIAKGIARTNEQISTSSTQMLEEGIRDLVTNPARALERMQREIRADEAGTAVFDIRHVETTPQGATFEYQVVDSSGGYQKTVKKPFILNDITGGFDVDGYKSRLTVGRLIESPNIKFQDVRDAMVSTYQRGLFASSKLRKDFSKEFGRIYRSAPHAERTKVSRALEQGNLESTIYDYNTLKGRFGMDDRGVAQYYEFRNLMDNAFHLKNREIATSYATSGFKQYSLDDQQYIMRQYDTPQSAEAAIEQTGTLDVLVVRGADDSFPLNLRATPDGSVSPQLRELMDEGYVLLRPNKANQAVHHGDNHYGMVLAKREEVTNITPDTPVLNYERGYVPIMYQDANYFGSRAVYGSVDGVTRQVDGHTTTYFTNRTDAEQWARENNIRHLQEQLGSRELAEQAVNDPNVNLPYSITTGRGMAAEEFDSLAFGGLYTGDRAPTRLRRGVEEESAEFVDPIYSMQKYMDNIANNLPLAAYRTGLERKWMEQARAVGAIPPEYNQGFRNAIESVRANTALDFQTKKFLEDAHTHIQYNNRVPTLGEQETAGRIVHWAERLEGILGKENRLSANLQRLDHIHGPDAIRAATFHTLLGLGNPAQFFIQAAGSTIAMSVNPVYASRGLPKAMGIGMLDNIIDPTAKAHALERMESTVPGITDAYRAWERTGFHADAVGASADYRSMLSSNPMGTDLASRAAGAGGNFLDKTAVFYKAGELFNRRISFSTALTRHLDQGGKLDEQGIKEVMNRTNTYLLHMDRSNKAEFQKGWFSVPTQFMQVHTRFIESMLGHQLSRSEKAKLATGQLALFGSLGIPFGPPMLGFFMDQAGIAPGDLREGEVAALTEGMTGVLLSQAFEIDVNAAPRGAIPFGIGEAIDRFFTEDATMWEVLSGAAGVLPDRAFQIGGSMANMLASGGFDPSNYDEHDLKAASSMLLEFASSTRNALGAYTLATNGHLRDARGNLVTTSTDPNIQTLIASGMGFQLTEIADMYDNLNSERMVNERIDNMVDMISDTLYRRYNAGAPMDEEMGRRVEIMIGMITDNEPPYIRDQVTQRLISRIENADTQMDRANRAMFERVINETYTSVDNMSRSNARKMQEAYDFMEQWSVEEE